jgi:hypothetical protein
MLLGNKYLELSYSQANERCAILQLPMFRVLLGRAHDNEGRILWRMEKIIKTVSCFDPARILCISVCMEPVVHSQASQPASQLFVLFVTRTETRY